MKQWIELFLNQQLLLKHSLLSFIPPVYYFALTPSVGINAEASGQLLIHIYMRTSKMGEILVLSVLIQNFFERIGTRNTSIKFRRLRWVKVVCLVSEMSLVDLKSYGK